MSESKVILNTPSSRTRQSLAKDLLDAGLTPGMNVIVHSSLSSLGWVCGGAVAVVQALMDAMRQQELVDNSSQINLSIKRQFYHIKIWI
ncbi:AAC(3) family N-acetyltransferase [Nostoc sp. CHAB 5784]|uniref:AAC(3) family N-acetyltransferase n=1 Tax=Nostoc mirabile TaxID=2907820 RepID=UPI001E48D8D1|nr:AAC(3) family N-acetyltransferase [Nostoc mirabile]MCC5667541.1 AAC(3) family N-acetyltransferase [Nostoc mirabile CHAB5784]